MADKNDDRQLTLAEKWAIDAAAYNSGTKYTIEHKQTQTYVCIYRLF